jgi:signal transduction histidine kinase/ActR/RegA family two-component response regulator
MSVPTSAEPSAERILVLAPVGRDAEITVDVLRRAELEAEAVQSAAELVRRLRETGAAILTWESLDAAAVRELSAFVAVQPPWSDVPILVFGPVDAAATAEAVALGELAPLGNVSLLERPIRVITLLSAVETALRARRRQYAMRDLLLRVEDGIRQRDQFLAMLGHELRNPLGAVLTAAEVIDLATRDDADPTVSIVARQAAAIRRQGGVLTRLVDDLLDVARVTSGKVPLRKRPLDVSEIVRRAVDAAGSRAAQKGVDVRARIQERPVWISGDATRLEQVVSNLLTNAIKYTPAGGRVDVTLSVEEGEAVLSLRDTGVGIEPELLPKVFDLFKQADRTLVRAEGGLGIGLTLVRTLVDLHGGTVVARSEGLGRGSEFIVRLPVVAPAAPAAPSPFLATAAGGARHPKVFVVEDHDDNREALVVLLEQIGCVVGWAADGEEGARAIVDGRPDVAIIDIGLPGMDGYAVAQHVRQALKQDVVLVALTGYGQPRDREMAAQAGFDVHLRKPVDVSQLRALVIGVHARSADSRT